MSNILEEVQQEVAARLSSSWQLSAVPFLVENRKDLDYEIKNRLGKQGLVGIVMTPKAQFAGKYEDLFLAWQLEELEVDVIENPPVNRGTSAYVTGQDAAMRVFDVLCPLSGDQEGAFCPQSYEEGEDSGLLVNRCVLKALVYGERGSTPSADPPVGMQFVKMLEGEPPQQPRNGWMWKDSRGVWWVCRDAAAYPLGVQMGQVEEYVAEEISSKADLSAVPVKTSQLSNDSGFLTAHQSLSDYYTKTETSSAAEIGAGLNGVQSYLTGYADAAAIYQYGRASAYTDRQVSSKADASSLSDYLGLTSTALQVVAGPVSFTHANGVYAERIDANGINFAYPDEDTYNSVQSDGVSSLLLRGDFNRASARLPIKDGGTIAYVSDVEQAVSSKADVSALGGYAETGWVNWKIQQAQTALTRQISAKADLSSMPYERDLSDMNVYADPMAGHTPMEVTVWHNEEISTLYVLDWDGSSWYYADGAASIQIYLDAYSNDYVLNASIQNMGGAIISLSKSFNLTSPLWSADFAAQYFHKIEVKSVKAHIATKEWVDSRLSALEARLAALEGA